MYAYCRILPCIHASAYNAMMQLHVNLSEHIGTCTVHAQVNYTFRQSRYMVVVLCYHSYQPSIAKSAKAGR